MAAGRAADLARFLQDNARWLVGGLVLCFASSFGQTFFIALFAEDLRLELGLSHGAWGSLYAAGTLASAAVFMALGKLADDVEPVRLVGYVFVGLALVAVAMANVTTAWMLGLVVFGLRLGGQAMMTHVAVTITARWFLATRGKALALVSMGHPLGEAVLPALAVLAIATFGWRGAWWAVAALLVLVLLPLSLTLLRRPRIPLGRPAAAGVAAASRGLGGRDWTRAEVVRHPLFWLLLPGFMVSPAFGTALLFQGAHLVAVKGWPIEAYALGFMAYAACSVVGSLLSGVLVDRVGAARLLPFYLVPLALSLALAGTVDRAAVVFVYLGLLGFGTGFGFALVAALWAELYGTAHLGAIRAIASGVGTFATAFGPGLTGLLLDQGVPIERQLVGLGGVTFLVCFAFALLAVHIRRLQRGLGPAPDRA
ncbi:MAG: MFS transporter [Geminicoccaceae bacterium]|nr:MAG: MFS transporter [Geminicoccaceae bacterium]